MMNLNGLTKIFTGNGGTIRFAIAGVTILGIVGTVVEHNYGVSGGSGNGRFFSFHPLGAVNTRQPAPCIVNQGRNVIDGSVESKENKIAEKNVWCLLYGRSSNESLSDIYNINL